MIVLEIYIYEKSKQVYVNHLYIFLLIWDKSIKINTKDSSEGKMHHMYNFGSDSVFHLYVIKLLYSVHIDE